MSKQKFKTINIDPRMFIGKPFTNCPKCGEKNCYGLLMVNAASYTKRCRECWHSENYTLPPLNKKVIYLDQFVISNMMKAINEKVGKKDKVDKVYLKLFEILDKMVKLQLIICPDSEFQRQESLLSFYKALKRMYEQLSHGTTFFDSQTIRRFQICEDFKNYIDTNNPGWKSVMDVDIVLHGDRNEWQSKLLVTVDSNIKQDEIESFRKSRLVTQEKFKQVYEYWQRDNKKTFAAFFKEISTGYGVGMVKNYMNSLTQYFQASLGVKTQTSENVFSFIGEESILISSLLRYLKDNTNDAENLKKIILYLQSDRFELIPFNEIYSSLWSAIAYQVSRGGRTSLPNIGMFNDIEMLSILYPYCDAIFVDNDIHSILNFGEVKNKLSKYKPKVFSLTNKEEFISYLEEITKKASKKHIEIIKNVYGEGWDTPFYEMFK